MKTWRDADHPTYLKPKRSTCYGCGCKCAKSAWGPWCHPCNVERMTRINKAMAGGPSATRGDTEALAAGRPATKPRWLNREVGTPARQEPASQ